MVLAGEYSTKETDANVMVRLALMGASPKLVDVMICDVYVKISYAPRLVEIDLAFEVTAEGSRCRIKDGVLLLTVPKVRPGKWGKVVLLPGVDLEKKEVIARRSGARTRASEAEQKLADRAKQRRHDDDRKAMRRRMDLEEEERSVIDDKKRDQRLEAEEETYATFREVAQKEAQLKEKHERAQKEAEKKSQETKSFFDMDQDALKELDDDLDDDDDKEEEACLPPVPPRLKSDAFGVRHTPRVFPTPMRESTAEDEHKWITKNKKHLHKNAMLSLPTKGKSIEDSDPTWLKSRGDKFFEGMDYLSAKNAYDAAMEVDQNWVELLGNRAACFLKLGDFQSCLRDCDRALELLEKEETKRPHLLAKILARRGAANCGIGNFKEASQDFTKAASYDDTKHLKEDAEQAMALEKASALKVEGDAFLNDSQPQEALKAYDEALEMDSTFIAALANRAAARLMVNDSHGAIADCTSALSLFETIARDDLETICCCGPLPPPASDKRRLWILRLVARRGAAHANLGNLNEAIPDYETATSIAPQDQQLKQDLDTLRLKAKQDNKEQNHETSSDNKALPPPPPPPTTT